MTSESSNTLRVSVNLNPEDISALYEDLRFEFGPFVVSPELAKQLRTMLALADKDLEDHDSELARLDKQIIDIQVKKQRLEAQRAELRALLSPMRKLPNETLLRIFQYTCGTNLIQCYPWLSSQDPPTEITTPIITCLPAMAVSSVCFRWRELALSSPDLWADLQVEIYSVTGKEVRRLTGFVDTVARYLERSGDWPLRLELTLLGPRSGWDFPSLTLLTQQAHRWQAFKYAGTHSLTAYDTFSRLHFPLLAQLDTRRIARSGDLHLFGHAPELSMLTTDAVSIPKTPYHHLDHLCLYIRSPLPLREALRCWPSIKSLELQQDTYFSGTDDWQVIQGPWPNVTSLTFGEPTNPSFSHIMYPSFNFPSLNKLVVTSVNQRTIWSANPLIAFVSRSSYMITSFTLCKLILSDLDLITALKVMPNLLHLEIDNQQWPGLPCSPLLHAPFTPHFISSLTRHNSTPTLVPKLHSLHLTSEFDGQVDDACFVRMVKSRWFKPGSKLSVKMLALGRGCIRSVVLKFTQREVDVDVYKPLRILEAEGLRIVVAGTNGVQV